MAMWAALVLVPLQMVLGDQQGRNTLQYQSTKLAALEGLWDSEEGVPASPIGWPDMTAERNLYEIAVPHLGSLYLTHSWNGAVQGLKAVPAADRPYVPIVYWAFRIMIGCGVLLLALAAAGGVLRWRRRLFTAGWIHLACACAMPLGFIAIIAGWTTTETGRQPFVVYGHLRAAAAAAPVATGAVLTSLMLFFVVYNVLLLAFFWYGACLVLRGPVDAEDTRSNAVRAGKEHAGPALVGVPPAHAAAEAAGD